jgi:hypothetical protein
MTNYVCRQSYIPIGVLHQWFNLNFQVMQRWLMHICLLHFKVTLVVANMAFQCFRAARTADEERCLLADATPKNNAYNRPIAHEVTASVTMHLEDKWAIYAQYNFCNKATFVKFYNDFVLKWLIFALYVVVVPEQILLGSIWRTL